MYVVQWAEETPGTANQHSGCTHPQVVGLQPLNSIYHDLADNEQALVTTLWELTAFVKEELICQIIIALSAPITAALYDQ